MLPRMKSSKTKVVLFNAQPSPKMAFDGPPLSIMMAASLLSLEDYQIKIVVWQYKNFEERLRQECADAEVFGVTMMTGFQIGKVLEAIRIARQANPRIQVVCGGWHPSLLPEQTLRHELIDFIVMGQGPWAFKALLEALRTGGSPADIPGLGFKKDGQLVLNPREPLRPITDFPVPPYHLLDDIEDFFVSASFGKRVIYLLTSQGCPGNCNFCSDAAFHERRWTTRPVDEVIATIQQFKEQYNIDGVMIGDSNFFVSEKRVAEICQKLIPLGLKWGGTSSRTDQLARYKDETWKLMKDSGLYDVFLGVESADNETLKLMNKGCTIEDTLAVLPKAKQYGIKMQCAFVIGCPGTNIQKEFKTDMDFINGLRKKGLCEQFHMFSFIPYPGVPFMKQSMELGYRQPENLEDWGDYHIHAHVTPWVPARYPAITDHLSFYFQFLTGNVRKVVELVTPPKWRWLTLPAERILRAIVDFRVTHCFFWFPLEYKTALFVLNHRKLFFGDKKVYF